MGEMAMNRRREWLWLRLHVMRACPRFGRYLCRVILAWAVCNVLVMIWMLIHTIPISFFEIKGGDRFGRIRGRYALDMTRIGEGFLFNDPLTSGAQATYEEGNGLEIEVDVTPSEFVVYSGGKISRYRFGEEVSYSRSHNQYEDASFRFEETGIGVEGKFPTMVLRNRFVDVVFHNADLFVVVREYGSGFAGVLFGWQSDSCYRLRFVRIGGLRNLTEGYEGSPE